MVQENQQTLSCSLELLPQCEAMQHHSILQTPNSIIRYDFNTQTS